MPKAVFLDRDGTLIEDRGHLDRDADVVFYPQTVNALRRLQERFLLFIVTNQCGVAEGIVTTEDVDHVNRRVRAYLANASVTITDVYVCPHARADGCICIKPNPHFIHRAAQDYGLDLQQSYAVGDHPHDVDFARNAGACGIYVLTGHGRKHRAELLGEPPVAAHIGEAADWILGRSDTGDPVEQQGRHVSGGE